MNAVPRSATARRLVRAGALVLLCYSGACAGRNRPPSLGPGPASAEPAMASVNPGWSQTGLASWYGDQFDGRPTASGETFDMNALTAAHRTLPLGTWIDVTNLDNGRRAELRVNDRGPFVKGRVLDVSRAAARKLGFLVDGTARVRIVVSTPPRACREVQVGAYRDEGNARAMVSRLEEEGESARTEAGPDGLTRVVAGPLDSDGASRVVQRFGGSVRSCGPES